MTLWKHTLIAIAAACTASTSFAAPVELDSVRVIVNEGVILQSDIDTSMKTLRANAKKSGQTLPSQDVLDEQVLEKLIIDTIQTQEAERIGVRIDDARLDQAIEGIAKDNNQTVEQLTASVAEEGLSYNAFREQVRKEIAASEARNERPALRQEEFGDHTSRQTYPGCCDEQRGCHSYLT